MKVIGEGSVHFYESQDECPHAPESVEGGGEEYWQESVVLYLWDVEQEVYVFFRLGQTPNYKGGTASLWANVWTPEYLHKYTNDEIPYDGTGRSEKTLSVGDDLCSYTYDGKHNWQYKTDEVSASLVMEDYHQGVGYFPESAGSLSSETAKNHMEATGWVTGSVSVKGKTYQVAGTGWRDHSWGKRNWLGILSHRFYPAMFGKEFNLFCVTFVGADGNLVKFGTVIEGDEVRFVDTFEVIAYMGEDGVSNCGGRLLLELDGETRVIEYEPIGKGAISMNHGFPCVDTLCKVRMDGKLGVGIAETSNRAQNGSDMPNVFPSSHGVIENGLFKQE